MGDWRELIPADLSADLSTQWSYADVAAYLGVSQATARKYASTGRLPKPDGRVGGSPWWRPETIQQWQTTRPGRGNWGPA